MPHHPRRNRVTPFGMLEAVAARGLLMGNRGDLHDRDGEIARNWKVKRWISCSLINPSGSHVVFDRPGRYTPLFFADDATAFAAGHRPCAYCRRRDYDRFREGWLAAFGSKLSADDMDSLLHEARMDALGGKVVFRSTATHLPEGVFVVDPDQPQAALLWRNGRLHPWTHDGYQKPVETALTKVFDVLTPRPIVAVLAALARAGTPWPDIAPKAS